MLQQILDNKALRPRRVPDMPERSGRSRTCAHDNDDSAAYKLLYLPEKRKP
jgi:hypothetical protein